MIVYHFFLAFAFSYMPYRLRLVNSISVLLEVYDLFYALAGLLHCVTITAVIIIPKPIATE